MYIKWMIMLVNETYTFIVVAKTGSLSKAARQLGQTPAAISKAITRLEEHYAIKLLTRTTRSVSMTDHGLIFYQNAENIVDTLRVAEDRLIQAQTNAKGKIRLGAPPSFSEVILSRLIPEFLERYPEIEIELILEKRREYPEPGEYDLLIKAGPLSSHSSFYGKHLVDWEGVLCASPTYLKKHGTPLSPDDLEQHVCLDYNYRLNGRLWHLYKDEMQGNNKFTKEYKIKIHTNVDTDGGIFVLAAARNGGGIILPPKFTVKEDIKNGILVPLLTEYYTQKVKVSFLHSYKPSAIPLRIKLLRDFIHQRVLELDYNNIDIHQQAPLATA